MQHCGKITYNFVEKVLAKNIKIKYKTTKPGRVGEP